MGSSSKIAPKKKSPQPPAQEGKTFSAEKRRISEISQFPHRPHPPDDTPGELLIRDVSRALAFESKTGSAALATCAVAKRGCAPPTSG